MSKHHTHSFTLDPYPYDALCSQMTREAVDLGFPHTVMIHASAWHDVLRDVMAWRDENCPAGTSMVSTPWLNAPAFVSFQCEDDALHFRMRFT
ncbi:hypothetical protein [Methylobacterium sp. Leaf85]|uniref:hypothetical protein n=1 Tax=Methylobacterium sp. Leaf85 TaxID=1736241 RepID=UPI0006F24BD4|nr:hypothetical protein [Methylobacterium sp. Leaf85]KQO43013.1 hypothetical protein ASF08_10570 [Methylobacterium sp. Leaf85]